MASASTLIKRAPALFRLQQRASLTKNVLTRKVVANRYGRAPSMLMASTSSSTWLPTTQIHHHMKQPFSALAQEPDYDEEPLLPTKHSRKLPPPVCPPSHLRSEVEAIFDAPVGTLIAYSKSQTGELKSAEEEMADAYYAADNVVQRLEYILRGLNSMISSESYVSRSLQVGAMSLEKGDDNTGGADNGDVMTKQDCFRAMLDLVSRIQEEGEAYDELRKRVRSQLTTSTDPTNSDSSSSSSSSDSDSDSDDEEGVSEKDEEVFNEWSDGLNDRMREVGFKVRQNSDSSSTSLNDASDDEEVSQEDYQFGASPGLTVHMVDLVLDALACLCEEEYGTKSSSSSVDLVQLMGKDALPPPAMGKELLDTVLHRHWLDGGDIGLNASGKVTAVGQGIGIGSGTGAGSLANKTPSTSFDIRTCPTPMTFNSVIRIASNFDPTAHAEAVEKYDILNGENGAKRSLKGADKDRLRQQQEMLRDITIDAAFSTYSRMKLCSALTLRALKDSTKNATSRSSVKRQAKLVSEGTLTGRNSATYAYLLRTVSNCIPPSLSRGNIAFGLYHKACVQEGVMDENVIKAMRSIGGYEEEGNDDGTSTPPVSNGPIFDKFLQAELGPGVSSALEKGRSLRQDRNYKLRRHVDWDGSY
jgi:hypothetical protein